MGPLSEHPSADIEEKKRILQDKWEEVIQILGMEKRFVTAKHISNESIADFMGVTLASVPTLRKKYLLSLLANLGHRKSAAWSKQQLTDKSLDIQKRVQDGDIELQAQIANEDSEIAKAQKAGKKLFHCLLEAPLCSWFMTPLTATAGLKEGWFNEKNIFRSLPEFFDSHYAK